MQNGLGRHIQFLRKREKKLVVKICNLEPGNLQLEHSQFPVFSMCFGKISKCLFFPDRDLLGQFSLFFSPVQWGPCRRLNQELPPQTPWQGSSYFIDKICSHTFLLLKSLASNAFFTPRHVCTSTSPFTPDTCLNTNQPVSQYLQEVGCPLFPTADIKSMPLSRICRSITSMAMAGSSGRP